MKPSTAFLTLALVSGCGGVSNYAYRFDISDPGAVNRQRPGERDTIEDADVRAEILVDPTSFQAVLLDITNKTDQDITINWQNVSIISPDGTQNPLHPDSAAPTVQPSARLTARLIPFALPSRGAAAQQYDNTTFELVVPMIVRGTPHEYRWHLLSRVSSL